MCQLCVVPKIVCCIYLKFCIVSVKVWLMLNLLINKKLVLSFFVFVFFAGNSFGQFHRKTDNGVKLYLPTMEVELQFYTPDIVRVNKMPRNMQHFQKSFSVVKSPESVFFQVEEKEQVMVLKSSSLTVSLDLGERILRAETAALAVLALYSCFK